MARFGHSIAGAVFASHLVMRGETPKAVQELLGHESIEMTLGYSHLTPDVKRRAVQALDAPPPARAPTAEDALHEARGDTFGDGREA